MPILSSARIHFLLVFALDLRPRRRAELVGAAFAIVMHGAILCALPFILYARFAAGEYALAWIPVAGVGWVLYADLVLIFLLQTFCTLSPRLRRRLFARMMQIREANPRVADRMARLHAVMGLRWRNILLQHVLVLVMVLYAGTLGLFSRFF